MAGCQWVAQLLHEADDGHGPVVGVALASGDVVARVTFLWPEEKGRLGEACWLDAGEKIQINGRVSHACAF
jgi:hypothetical protein